MSDLLLKFECKGLIAVGNYFFLTEIIFKDSRYCIEEVLNAIKETQDEIALLKWKSSRIKSYSDRAETPKLSLETGVRLWSIGSSTNLQGETTPGRTASLKFQPRNQQVATVRPHSRKDNDAASPERLDSSTNLHGKTTKVKADSPDFLLIDMKTDTVRHIFTKHNNDSDPPYSSSQCHGDRDASDKAMNNAVSSAPINSLGMALLGGQTMNRLDTVASDADGAATPMDVALSKGLQIGMTQVHTVSPTLEPTDLRTCIVRPHIYPHANGCGARYSSCQCHDYVDTSDKAMNNVVSAAPMDNLGMAFSYGQTRNRLNTVASDADVAANPMGVALSTGLHMDKTRVHTVSPMLEPIDLRTCIVRPHIKPLENGCDQPYSSSQCHHDGDTSDTAIDRQVHTVSPTLEPIDLRTCIVRPHIKPFENAATSMGVALSTVLQMDKTRVHTVLPTLEPIDLRTCIVRHHIKPLENGCDQPYSSSQCHHDGDTSDTAIDRQVHTVSPRLEPIDLSTCIVRPHIKQLENGCDPRYSSCQCHDYVDTSDKAMDNAVSAAPKDNQGMAFTSGQTRNSIYTVALDAADEAQPRENTKVHLVPPVLQTYDQQMVIVSPVIKKDSTGTEASTVVRDDELQKMTDAVNAIGGTWRVVQCNENAVSNTKQPGFESLRFSSKHPGYGDTSDIAVDKVVSTGPKDSQGIAPSRRKKSTHRDSVASEADVGCEPPRTSSKHHGYGDTSHIAVDKVISTGPMNSLGLAPPQTKKRTHQDSVASKADMGFYGMVSSWG